MRLFDDQLSDVIMGSNHGPMGDVTTILGPLACRDGFTLNGYRQVDDPTLSDHIALFIFRIQLIVRII